MKEIMLNSAIIGVVINLVTYEIGVLIQKKLKVPILNPLLISMVLSIVVLCIGKIDYETYNVSGRYLSFLLTPTTVCLAIPLYEKLHILKKNLWAILGGILAGVIGGLSCILALSVLFRLAHEEYVTLLPKSITAAIGMGLSDELGGYATITMACIIITGIFGNIFAEYICKFFRIKHPVAVGIAIGTSAHAFGTTKAMEIGEVEGAMSGLAIVVTGLFTVVAAPIFAMIW